MKLYKEGTVPEDQVPPEPILIAESDDLEELKRKAEDMARDSGEPDLVWDVINDPQQEIIMQLPVYEDSYRLFIRR
jgi:hypothetical protein